jgi:CPA1 family monovalent cation:H+ antiporter
MSVAGVRGAITLAGVLTLPLALSNGEPFPARDLAIFLAMGVIVVSLVVASTTLPLLLKDLKIPPGPSRDVEESRARIAAAEAAIAEIERVQHELSKGRKDADAYVLVAARVMDTYRARIDSRSGDEAAVATAKRDEVIEREIRLAALKAERNEIFRKVRARLLGTEIARKLVRELDLLEARYSG